MKINNKFKIMERFVIYILLVALGFMFALMIFLLGGAGLGLATGTYFMRPTFDYEKQLEEYNSKLEEYNIQILERLERLERLEKKKWYTTNQ